MAPATNATMPGPKPDARCLVQAATIVTDPDGGYYSLLTSGYEQWKRVGVRMLHGPGLGWLETCYEADG